MKPLFALVLGAALFGCAGAKKNPNDPDSAQEKAEAVPLGGRVQDKLEFSTPSGDPLDGIDWKAIDIPEAGKLRVTVLFGNPVCFCSVELFDPKGKSLQLHKEIKKEPRVDLVVAEAKPGRYLLKFSAKYAGDVSEYLVEPVFAAAPKPVKSSEPDDEDPVTPVAGSDPKPSETPAAVTESTLVATITKSKPGRAGYLLLTLDKGSADGLAEGTQGVISGVANGELRVTKVEANTAQAETAVSAKALKGHNEVTLTIKK